jgi:hypothetical protein
VQNDVTYLAIVLGLFALMFALVKACDLIIGSDEAAWEERGGAPGPEAVAEDDDESIAA